MGKLATDLPGASALAALRSICGQRHSLDRREFAMIHSARALGVGWGRIAEALGLDTADAKRRHEELDARVTVPDLR